MSEVKISKHLSLILRHDPASAGIVLDAHGWANVKDILSALHITKAQLDDIVDNNNKKRFEYNNETGTKIRARQGHSIDVDLQYEPMEPPELLYHGTATRFLDSIFKDGIKKMSRHMVHLSADVETAVKVGKRHGKPIVLTVKAKMMYDSGAKFYRTDNNVWLTEHIPSNMIEFHNHA